MRAMFDLAQRHGDGPIPLKMIAERQGISEHYLEQLMSTLRKAGLVTSVRGAQGGYRLAQEPHAVTVGDIIRALEGPVLTVYGEESEEDGAARSDNVEQIVILNMWRRLGDMVNRALDSVTLASLCDDAARMKAHNDSFMYHI